MNNSQNHDKTVAEIPRWSFLAFIIVYTILIKLMPYFLYRMGMDVEANFAIYPWNFTPLFAVCLFGGAVYRSKMNAIWAPVAMMFVADLGIWAITQKVEWAFYPNQWVVYGATILCAMLGYLLRTKRSWGKIAGAGFASCLIFYLITNFGVWVNSSTYSKDLSGLITCYVAALPFLQNSLIATGLFSAVLFSPACLQIVNVPEFQDATDPEFAPATAS